jgi:hypothetical protein
VTCVHRDSPWSAGRTVTLSRRRSGAALGLTRAVAAASSLLEVGVLIDLSPQEAAVAAGRAAATGVAVVATDRGLSAGPWALAKITTRRDD